MEMIEVPTVRSNLILDRRVCKKKSWTKKKAGHFGSNMDYFMQIFFSILRREELFYSQRLRSSLKS